MRLQSVRVKSFRSILEQTLECDELTALVGPNGAGKSTFLRALDLFYTKSPRIEHDDFYNAETVNAEIVIAVTFTNLSDAAKELFASYIDGTTLTIERVFAISEGKISGAYHGSSLQAAEFESIRSGLDVKDRGATAKAVYNDVRSKPDFKDLPEWTTLGNVVPTLNAWEQKHPEKCVRRRDDGRFFGFAEVGRGYLGRFTRFLFIPAVRDAATDAAEGRGSVLTELMDMVVRSVLANKAAVVKLKQETQQKYEEIMKPDQLPELQQLSGKLTSTLQTFAPNASIDLKWLPLQPVEINLPRADIRLVEDRFSTTVHRTGHGLQRAFILTMLQHLAMARLTAIEPKGLDEAEKLVKEELPNLLLAIEEPELYQHPNRQRHLSKIFLSLAEGKTPGVAEHTQIIYATHSPLFVDLERFNQIRIVRKKDDAPKKPKVTTVLSSSLNDIAEDLWKLDGSVGAKYTGGELKLRLHSIMTPWVNEGFFAQTVVLVEGEDDCAVVTGMARAVKENLEGRGISVIPVGGKRSMDRPALIFKKLGISTFLLWDSDGGKGQTAGVCEKCGKALDGKPDPLENRRLLRLLGVQEEDWPSLHGQDHCCFGRDLESTLKEELGVDLFEELLSACKVEFGISKRKHALKNPLVIATILERAHVKGAASKTLKRVLTDIVAMSDSANAP